MKTSGRLNDKVAIITGAASGIGKATAILFARENATVALADVNEDGLKDVQTAIREQGGTAIIKKTNVADEDDVKSLITQTLDAYSKIDILCNNAGFGGDMSPLDQQDKNVWNNVYAVNVLGAVFAVKHVARHMQERKTGAIVNVASVAGIRSGAGGNAYSASKAALMNFTQTAACDLGGYNVRVNAVCPGLIKTAMMKPVFDYAEKANKTHKLGSRCELRRYGLPEEVAYAILFLAGDESSYITGHSLPVEGGNSASLNLPGMKA